MVIIDDFIKDQNLLNDINKDSTFFGPNGNFMWWDGWWNSPVDTVKKRLIEYIWKDNSFLDLKGIFGFEYWTGVYGPSKEHKDLPTHFDKDELLYEETGKMVSPVMGTVFYPSPIPFEGGYLEIDSKGEKTEVIQAKYNRLVIFPAGDLPHRVTPVLSGTRHAIAINLWNQVPLAVERNIMTIE
jgi:predicted 2-oxoglutarate/Fe(II)-dependent dioxygenase YbiX